MTRKFAAFLIVFSTIITSIGAASADPPQPLNLPGQIGPAIAYTTPQGTPAWRYYVYAGGPADNFHYAQVALPANFNTTTPTPTVLAVHGATATEEQLFTYSTATLGGNAMLNSWLDRGWAVIATREGSTVKLNRAGVLVGSNGQWGSQASAAGMADAWLWAQSAWTPDSHGFMVYGWSMGGAGALNFAAEAQRRGYPVGAVDVVDGVTNLRASYLQSAKFAKGIRTAYSLPAGTIPGDGNWIAKVDSHDPQLMVPNLTAFPLRMSASSNDPTVNKTNNSALLFDTLNSHGWSAELSYWSYGGGHCSKSHFNPIDANAFFNRALTP